LHRLDQARNLVRLSFDLEQTMGSGQTVSPRELPQGNPRKFLTELRIASHPDLLLRKG
jgi:hypothetical protein